MGAYQIIYSNIVADEDIPRLGKAESESIEQAINTKLTKAPEDFGKPLRRPYQGYWTLRQGNYRIIYSVTRQLVRVVAILPRDRAYTELLKRL